MSTAELVTTTDRREGSLASITEKNIKTPAEFAERLRLAAEHAFILSPTTAVSMIAPGYEIVPVVVAIDTSVDAESGRGAEVYHQRAIHKGIYSGSGKDRRYTPTEVSLNKYGLLRILSAYGVNVEPTQWVKDGSGADRYLWICSVSGTIREFDGALRRLPSGTGSLDAQDGAADIGEWEPVEWARRVAIAEKQKEKTPKEDQWKCKPEPINGWTYERVLGVRRFGRQLSETKALNRLARNLGIRQSYTIEELKRKPFVIMRPVFMPDMTDPAIRQMITAQNLNASAALYPSSPTTMRMLDVPQEEQVGPISHAAGEITETLTGTVEPEPVERMVTDAVPADAEEVTFTDAQPTVDSDKDQKEQYTITRVMRRGTGATAKYFAETVEGIVLFAPEAEIARACSEAAKDKKPRIIPTERVLVDGHAYRQIVEIVAPH